MSTVDATELLRPGLLEGVSILLAGARAPSALGDSVRRSCTDLGARVLECSVSLGDPGGEDDTAVERAAQHAVEHALADGGSIDSLVIDGASVFARSADAREALRACLDFSWNVTRTVASAAFLPDARGGRIVYLAPPAGNGEHADAARAGLENLARTLSIEWARHAVSTVAIASREGSAAEVAALTGFLASAAGAYYSGCVLDLRGADRG
jgi:NAD(P)-dependent dehydrogenase (short-subunit alcohol dehydrogenase family)